MPITRYPTQPTETKYLFIDGAYLDEINKKIASACFDHAYFDLNYASIGAGYKRVFYYDCLPGQKVGESEEEYKIRTEDKRTFLENLGQLPGFHVRQGVVVRAGRGNHQKTIDVKIAVDMFSHTMQRNMESATLLAGDLDFLPVIKALVRAGMHVVLWYEKTSVSRELLQKVDEAEVLCDKRMFRWSTQAFRQRYAQPECLNVYTDGKIILENGELVKSGTAVGREKIELRKYEDKWCIVEWKAHGELNFYRHEDLKFLEYYLRDRQVLIIWENT
jgi:hypothetical protein